MDNELAVATFCSASVLAILVANVPLTLSAKIDKYYQRWSRGHKARGQGQGQGHKKNPRPRPRPRTVFPRTDTLEAKNRNAQGQGQGQGHKRKCSPKKKVFTKIFQAISKKIKNKKGLHKNFSSDLHEKTFSKKFFKRSTKF